MRPDRYGRFYVEGKWAYPHRFAYELLENEAQVRRYHEKRAAS